MIPLILLLAAQFPSASATSWMEPAAFHLTLGTARSDVERAFAKHGWSLQKESPTTLVHDYADGKAVVLDFRDDRLSSIRFELVSFVPALEDDWRAVVDRMKELFGAPDFLSESLLIAYAGEMTVHAVLEHKPESELGKQGAGRVIIRYFVPSDVTGSRDTSR